MRGHDSDGLVQDCSNSIANALELLQSCTKPSTLSWNFLSQGIHGTASNLVNVAVNEHEQKGMTGAVGGVLRQIPPTVIQPVIIATEATSNVLGGMRNQLRPDRRREDEDKWKPDDDWVWN